MANALDDLTAVERQALKPVGHTFTDASGRKLRVTAACVSEDGRDIVGALTNLDGSTAWYATSQAIFDAVWVQRTAAWIAPEAVRRGG